MKLKMILFILIVAMSALLSFYIIKESSENQINKIENAELNHIRYGLLSIDSWKEHLSDIILEEIDKIELSKGNEDNLRRSLEAQLYVLIDKVNERIEKSNSKTFKGRIKQAFIDIFVSVDEIKKGVPEYADAMIKEIKKPKHQIQIRTILKEKIIHYINSSFDDQDKSAIERILERTNCLKVQEATTKLQADIAKLCSKIYFQSLALIILAALLFTITAFSKEGMPPYQYISLVCMLLILLITGISTPMIDMEAKISQMTFMLFGHPMKFENQVLYFQTKSILDVFWIMITHESLQMKFVGILMVLFSVVFPVSKLISSLAYYYDCKGSRKSKLINFFVLKSGKWSMADVMVVAIFMAYIGFNGIISSQFAKLANGSREIAMITTNGTSMQPGYYIFVTYAFLAMILSHFLVKLPCKDHFQSEG